MSNFSASRNNSIPSDPLPFGHPSATTALSQISFELPLPLHPVLLRDLEHREHAVRCPCRVNNDSIFRPLWEQSFHPAVVYRRSRTRRAIPAARRGFSEERIPFLYVTLSRLPAPNRKISEIE